MVRSILDTNSSRLVTLSGAKSLPNTAEIPRYARNDVQREFCYMVKMSLPITISLNSLCNSVNFPRNSV
jgi:hypothetical protein